MASKWLVAGTAAMLALASPAAAVSISSRHNLQQSLSAESQTDTLARTEITSSDFEHGTLIIDKPGRYRLMESVSFEPKTNGQLSKDAPETWMYPDRALDGGKYASPAYNLGFFAAIAITSDNVTLDLNGHTIEQSKNHALIQRFFSVIELNSSPFPANTGPTDFGDETTFKAAHNVVIRNGKTGRSSHHGIHGNSNNNIKLIGLEVTDFE